MKKLLFFLMFAIPILAILIVKLTAGFTAGNMYVTIERIVLDPDEINDASVGDSRNLVCKIYPAIVSNKEVIWTSDNEEAAIVDDKGHVEFVGIGDGHILATTKEGNKRAMCSFHVGDTKVHKVKLSADPNFVYIGKKIAVTATILPEEALVKGVTFYSSDDSIAEVDPRNGFVTGISAGNVIITAVTDDGGFTDSISISVRNPVTSLRPVQNEVITAKETEQVEFILEPFNATNKNVKFEVDNPEIATVNEIGVITFLKAGEVNVTITTEDGGFTSTIKYIYTAGYIYNIVMENTIIDMFEGDNCYIQYQTIPVILDQSAVTITSDDENIAYVENGYLYAVKGGHTTVRLKYNKSADQQEEVQIYVNVKSLATEVVLDDVVTAESVCQLSPSAIADGPTEEILYFYHTESENVIVDEDGVVTFTADGPCEATIRVYANADQSDVYKDVKVTYTAGKVYSVNLIDKNITINYGDTVGLNYNIIPADATIKNISLSVISGNEVVEVLGDRIHATLGGKAQVKLECELYNGSVAEEICEVNVIRLAEKITILTDLAFYTEYEQYVSADEIITFSGEVLPQDTTDKNIIWSIDSGDAIIRDNTLIFNQTGIVVLTATVGEISNSIEINYVGTNPVYAEVQAQMNGDQIAVPETIDVDDSFEIVVSKIIPNYTQLPNIIIEVKNENTLSPLGHVLSVEGNKITALAGGTATLVVNISNSVRINLPITVVRKPAEISVLQANTQQTSAVVNLVSEVLPYDTTNKNVRYIVHNTDVATVEGNVLTFKTVGVASLTAIAEANEDIRVDFVVERIEKNTIHLSLKTTSLDMNSGDLLAFDAQEEYTISIDSQNALQPDKNVVSIEGERYIRAVSGGSAVVKISTTNNNYQITITVSQLVENVVLQNDLDFYDDMYVVATNQLDLNFKVYPECAANQEVTLKAIKSIPLDGKNDKIATIYNNKLTFFKAGILTLEVKSADENFVTVYTIKYTGGGAEDAILNVESSITMTIGQQIVLGVNKWIPKDTTNTRFIIKDIINTSGKKVVEISDKTITAVDSGSAKLVLELSSGLEKEIEIICANSVKDLVVPSSIETAQQQVELNVQVLPSNATNKTLTYTLEDNDNIATILNNVVTFLKPGTVVVHISTTDGSEIERTVQITSTMGYLNKIELSTSEVNIERGSSVNLYTTKYPSDAQNGEVKFKIISQLALSGQGDVIRLNDDGSVVGLFSGEAVVRAYAYDFYGEEVYADCTIKVYTPLKSLEVKFADDLETFTNKNTFATSRSELEFSLVGNPVDAQLQNVRYEISDPSAVQIEENIIKFLQATRVTIKFICQDENSTEFSVSYTFYYTGNNLIQASLNKNQFADNVIRLKAGESIKFELEKVVPSDNSNLIFTISDTAEGRNDNNKAVASFSGGVLYALNGGTFTFTLLVNGYKLDNLTLIVSQDATDISIEGKSEVYVSITTYNIFAHVLPTDSHQNKLGFTSKNPDIASVDSDGRVTFSQFGECEIEVYVVDNPSVNTIVKVTYTKELRRLVFNDTLDAMFVSGNPIYFTVYAEPTDAIDFEYDIDIDNKEIASLTYNEGAYQLSAIKPGKVTVTATAKKNKDISVSRTITIYDKITKIELKLDENGDVNGQGGYRIFANHFYNSTNEVVNTYQMEVSLTPSDIPKQLLKWSSNNEDVATVDQNGVVTFLSTGKVTITVRQDSPIVGVNMAYDSYTFTVVEGVNIYTPEQFERAHVWLTELNKEREDNYAYLVLHDNITIRSNFASVADYGIVKVNYNICGNGYKIDHSNIENSDHFIINRNNIIIDNVILCGTAYNSDAGVASLMRKGSTLRVNYSSNVLIYNTIIENAEVALEFTCSQARVDGCIFRNCLTAGIKISRDVKNVSNITVANSIFTSSFCGVLFSFDQFESTVENQLTLEGYVYFYNWSTINDINNMFDLKSLLGKIGLSVATDSIINQIKDLANSKGQAFAVNYNGETYYNFGVVKFEAKVPKMPIKTYAKYTYNKLNPICKYSVFSFSGPVQLAINIEISCEIFAISNQNIGSHGPFVGPSANYTNDNSQNEIRQKSRF